MVQLCAVFFLKIKSIKRQFLEQRDMQSLNKFAKYYNLTKTYNIKASFK